MVPLQSDDRWKVVKLAEPGVCKPQIFRRPFYQSRMVGHCTEHANCTCTESASIAYRVFVQQPTLSEQVKLLQRQIVRRWCSMVATWGVKPYSMEEYVKHSPSPALYGRALKALKERGRCDNMAFVKMFVKADKIDNRRVLPHKPRAIQSRGPAFNIIFGRYVKPLACRTASTKGVHGGMVRCFAKGRNARQRGLDITKKLERFDKCCVYVLDATSFDGSVQQQHLRCVHKTYRAAFGRQEDLEWALRSQLVNRVYTKGGTVYVIEGNRMSGDSDTGSGNDIISYINAYVATRLVGIKDYEVYIDGDDMLLFCDVSEACSDAEMDVAFAACGFKTRASSQRYPDLDESQIEFGRSRLGRDDNGPVLFRNPARALACFGVSHKYPDIKSYLEVLKGTAHGEAVVSSGVPMLGELAYHVHQSLSGRERYDFEYHKRREYMDAVKRPVVRPQVDVTARISVERCWGVSVESQMFFEARVPQIVDGLSNDWQQVRDVVCDGPTVQWMDTFGPVWE